MSATNTLSPVPAQWEIEWRVLRVTASEAMRNARRVTLESRLIEDLGMDSLAAVDLILSLEEEFDITLLDGSRSQQLFTHSPVTVRDLVGLVQQQWGTGTPARKNWRRRPAPPAGEQVPFTQLGPAAADKRTNEPLYVPIGTNREGHAEHRRSTDGMRCVFIPSGKALLGTNAPDALDDQRPAHTARVSAFLMDAEPVSHAAFARFLNSVGAVSPPIMAEWCGVPEDDQRRAQYALKRSRRGWTPTAGTERQPMMLVSWWGAKAYSLWAHGLDCSGYRTDAECGHLPSEAQWEYVARGGSASAVTDAHCATARVAQHTAGAKYEADTMPAARVCERLGMSPFGVHHMAGNVWQWCRDWYDPAFYQWPEAQEANPQNVAHTGIRSERGGSWVGPAELAAPWYRRGRPPEARGRCLGFRCVGRPPVTYSRRGDTVVRVSSSSTL